MNVVEIARRGGPEVLRWCQKPTPVPGAGEVRIAVHAAGVNFADVLGRRGLYPDAPKGAYVPGYEVAGTIDALGPGVTGFEPGDRVLALTRFNGYASHALTTPAHVMRLPDGWDFVRAAAVPTVYLTAYMALIRQARLQKGDRLLIHGAAGGVGIAAIQIARHVGARIAGTCGSEAKVQFLREQGVEWPINYHHEPVERVIRRDIGALDVILDPQGGETTSKGLKLLDHGGRLILYGIANSATGGTRNLFSFAKTILPLLALNPLSLMANNAGIFGLNLLNLWGHDAKLQEAFAWLHEAMVSGVIDPIIDSTFPLAQAGEAHGRLESRSNIGKVVLTIEP